MIHHPYTAAIAILAYCAALGIFLKWCTDHAATLDDDDERGLSDDEIEEARIVRERGE